MIYKVWFGFWHVWLFSLLITRECFFVCVEIKSADLEWNRICDVFSGIKTQFPTSVVKTWLLLILAHCLVYVFFCNSHKKRKIATENLDLGQILFDPLVYFSWSNTVCVSSDQPSCPWWHFRRRTETVTGRKTSLPLPACVYLTAVTLQNAGLKAAVTWRWSQRASYKWIRSGLFQHFVSASQEEELVLSDTGAP